MMRGARTVLMAIATAACAACGSGSDAVTPPPASTGAMSAPARDYLNAALTVLQ